MYLFVLLLSSTLLRCGDLRILYFLDAGFISLKVKAVFICTSCALMLNSEKEKQEEEKGDDFHHILLDLLYILQYLNEIMMM